MANYTLELRQIVESGRNIFPFHYDFYDEKKRSKFERDFIRHFYFYEIGSETIDRFILHLEDKMNTVFPFYNTLLKTAQTEYSYLENYDMKEETVVTRDTEGKVAGVSSSVGQVFDTQSTTSETAGNSSEKGTSENTRTNHSETDTTNSETVDSETANSKNGNNVKKFLDTPMGQVNLTNSNYVTNVTQDDYQESGTGSEDRTTTSEGASETDGTETAAGETNLDRESSETTESTLNGEQKTTADNNTRSETIGKETIKTEHFRHGNIGVQTATDMMEKHIELQKKLSRILEMFFEECHDLFMMVY